MTRGGFMLATSLRHRLSRCYGAVPRHKYPLWVVPMCTASHHRKYCTRNAPKVVYDPKHDMSEEEVKHIKLEPIPAPFVPPDTKYALLLSFNGQGYHGLQRNLTGNSVEDYLLKAMLDANFITEEQFLVPQLFQYQRSSRTDKRVSAARLLISGIFSSCDKLEIKEKLNQRLDDQIRVMAVFKTTKRFSCKTWCDSRTYSYTCPTFAFASYQEIIQDSYRLPADALEEVRELFAEYKGVHNFHNFTSGITPQDPRAKRRVLDIECGEPFEHEGLEWITIKIKGVSFLLHQIRKMIGLVIAIRQGLASINFIPQALSQDYAYLPIAPGLGLVLEDQHFDVYNRKVASKNNNRKVASKNNVESLIWDSEAEVIEEYRQRNIIAPILDTELRERSMFTWLPTLHCFSFDIIKESEKESRDRKQRWLSQDNPSLVVLARLAHLQKSIGGSLGDVLTHTSHLNEDPENVEVTTSNIKGDTQASNPTPVFGFKSLASDS